MCPETESAATPFAVEVPHRLPLAEAFDTVWGSLASDVLLADLFDRQRGRGDEDQLTFAELVRVLADAPTRSHGRGRGAILDAVARNPISSPVRAGYGQFCAPIHPRRFADGEDHFVIRDSHDTRYHPAPTRAAAILNG